MVLEVSRLTPPKITAALLSRQPHSQAILRFLFRGKEDYRFLRDLRVPPAITSHCNLIKEDAFMVPGARFGVDRDFSLIPLVRQVVAETLQSYRGYYPQIEAYLDAIPIAAYGSMGLSARRQGRIDWDYIRDLDFRVWLPPQIGHTSGFKSALEQKLDLALRHQGLKPVFRGRNEEDLPQVQIQERENGAIHGFHFYLLRLVPGFIKADIHEGGGYSLHHAYFPESAIDTYLAEGLLWQELLDREVETYASMFNRVGYYLFSDDAGKPNAIKKRGWYSHKAFKWYATLARLRGDFELEAQLLAQYDLFKVSNEDPQYLVRDTYWSRLNPERAESRLLERDIARAFSMEYSLGRCPDGDPLVGHRVSEEADAALILEPLDRVWLQAALAFLGGNADTLPFLTCETLARLQEWGERLRVRFADDLDAPTILTFPDGEPGLALPSGWALVFTDGYARLAAKEVSPYDGDFSGEEIRTALITLLAARIAQACRPF